MLASRLNTGVVTATLLRLFLVIFSSLLLTANRAQADDMSFAGGSGCGDPPIFSQVFTFTANSNGGFCTGFGNHSGANFDSLRFTTSIPNANPSAPFLCSPEPFFLNCTFSLDT